MEIPDSDFIKLVDGKNSRPNEGLLIIRRMDKTEYVRGYWNSGQGSANRKFSFIPTLRVLHISYIPRSEWTPICAFNFKEQQQACEDLGFSGFLGYTETHSDSINGGKWQISDGWREDYAYGKHPNTELGSMLINEKPKRNIFHILNTPLNYRLYIGGLYNMGNVICVTQVPDPCAILYNEHYIIMVHMDIMKYGI